MGAGLFDEGIGIRWMLGRIVLATAGMRRFAFTKNQLEMLVSERITT
tara:strand:+ start:475 stop:615 length:141 start_codon:yes stop_codon:yes gene_type:complete